MILTNKIIIYLHPALFDKSMLIVKGKLDI